MAATNKSLAKINKARTGGKATKKRSLPAVKYIELIEEIVEESAPWANKKAAINAEARPNLAPAGRSNDARQVRGHRCHRQGAQAQQQEPRLLALRRDPLRRTPAEQVLAQGRGGLQPRRMGGQPCAGRTQCQPLAQGTVCRGHRDHRGEASVMRSPTSWQAASTARLTLPVTGGSRAATRPGRASSIACSSSTALLTLPDDDFTKP